MSNVHRKKYSEKNVDCYKEKFIENSLLPNDNLVVLSNNLSIDISIENDYTKYDPSDDLERMLNIIFKE